MFGMRYPIDVVFLDERFAVVHTIPGLAPWATSPRIGAATSVIELPAGTLARVGVAPGTRLVITNGGAPVETAPPAAEAGGGAGALAVNVLMAAFYALFAAAHWELLRQGGRWGTILPIFLQETLLVALFLSRRRSRATSARPGDWLLGVAGTFLPLLMRAHEPLGALAWIGRPVQIAGLVLALVAVAGLGRSFGIVPAHRGLRTAGPYRVVRHPLYAAYALTYVGFLLSYPRALNVLLVGVTLAVMYLRAVAEERLLADDPAYRAYRERTRWRFVPGVA
jgi:protein-S-isoprenylcysteine O-methyltransferase Ste14